MAPSGLIPGVKFGWGLLMEVGSSLWWSETLYLNGSSDWGRRLWPCFCSLRPSACAPSCPGPGVEIRRATLRLHFPSLFRDRWSSVLWRTRLSGISGYLPCPSLRLSSFSLFALSLVIWRLPGSSKWCRPMCRCVCLRVHVYLTRTRDKAQGGQFSMWWCPEHGEVASEAVGLGWNTPQSEALWEGLRASWKE